MQRVISALLKVLKILSKDMAFSSPWSPASGTHTVHVALTDDGGARGNNTSSFAWHFQWVVAILQMVFPGWLDL